MNPEEHGHPILDDGESYYNFHPSEVQAPEINHLVHGCSEDMYNKEHIDPRYSSAATVNEYALQSKSGVLKII